MRAKWGAPAGKRRQVLFSKNMARTPQKMADSRVRSEAKTQQLRSREAGKAPHSAGNKIDFE